MKISLTAGSLNSTEQIEILKQCDLIFIPKGYGNLEKYKALYGERVVFLSWVASSRVILDYLKVRSSPGSKYSRPCSAYEELQELETIYSALPKNIPIDFYDLEIIETSEPPLTLTLNDEIYSVCGS